MLENEEFYKKLYYKETDVALQEIMNEKDTGKRNKLYDHYVTSITPKHSTKKNVLNAFLVGGLVCTLGQALLNLYKYVGFDKDTAALYETLTLVLISAVLTGFGLFAKIAKFAGAGVIVPITGFANSVASPAIEFKKEGQVYGIGCKIFTIAGPVILYGVFTSCVLGFIYWILTILGWC